MELQYSGGHQSFEDVQKYSINDLTYGVDPELEGRYNEISEEARTMNTDDDMTPRAGYFSMNDPDKSIGIGMGLVGPTTVLEMQPMPSSRSSSGSGTRNGYR